MAIERTFSMIKPDATRRNLTGAITAKLEAAGLRVVASKRVWMSRRQAEGFYAVHKGRPFFDELVEFMSSAPTVVQVLEGENAIAKNREVMGATNPANAAEGTIRKEFALSIGENSVHGSDAPRRPPRRSSTGSRISRSSADTAGQRSPKSPRRTPVAGFFLGTRRRPSPRRNQPAASPLKPASGTPLTRGAGLTETTTC